MRILVAGNGPSALEAYGRPWDSADRSFLTNYFFLGENHQQEPTDWFVCEDVADCRCVKAYLSAMKHHCEWYETPPTIWLPGIREDVCDDLRRNHLAGLPVKIQKRATLPDGCRWDHDPAPYRPLMGSFAIAAAVGMQPDELYLCGHDLFSHPAKQTHAGATHETRNWQTEFNREYCDEKHRNHRKSGDVRYIRAALQAYKGDLVCVGSVMKDIFASEFPQWEWLEG